MRGGLRILARNNFAGRANPTRIFAGQVRGGLARFATPTNLILYLKITLFGKIEVAYIKLKRQLLMSNVNIISITYEKAF